MISNKAKKLLNRPIDKDTTIHMEHIVESKAFNCEALMELWSWEGVSASSIIFLADDLILYDDEEILKKVFEIDLPSYNDERKTIKRSGEFVYINFGFKTEN